MNGPPVSRFPNIESVMPVSFSLISQPLGRDTQPARCGTPALDVRLRRHQSVLEWTDEQLFAYDTGRVRSLGTPLSAQIAGAVTRCWAGRTGSTSTTAPCGCRSRPRSDSGWHTGPDYVVLGNKRIQARQCGNAVTPPVTELLGLALREAFTDEDL
ncbi:hypothetical protein [Pseudonocardia sp. GCM10023141]|uniref:hypothetical protein n=1 Tax=Pseudonocardia sp. GCM10023141 TaxID=3252653 RepID=UPI00360C600B